MSIKITTTTVKEREPQLEEGWGQIERFIVMRSSIVGLGFHHGLNDLAGSSGADTVDSCELLGICRKAGTDAPEMLQEVFCPIRADTRKGLENAALACGSALCLDLPDGNTALALPESLVNLVR